MNGFFVCFPNTVVWPGQSSIQVAYVATGDGFGRLFDGREFCTLKRA